MNPVWQKNLEQAGALVKETGEACFDTPQTEVRLAATENIVTALVDHVVLRVTGDDAATFLLGQLTNDLGMVDETHHQLSAYCTPKGRMLALFRIYRHEEAYGLIVPMDIAEAVARRLRMYVLRSQVTIEIDTDKVLIGLSGPDAEAILKPVLGPAVEITESCISNGLVSLHIAGPMPRFLLIAPIDKAADLWGALASKARSTGPTAWAWLDISSGIPRVTSDTSEAFIPQMANLDLVDGISFKKGCYPGQEIVARMKYLGKLKQRMRRAHTNGEPPAAGTPIYAPAFGEQAAGTVALAAPAADGGADMLIVMQDKAYESGVTHLASADGPLIELLDLPYAIPAAQEKSG